MWKTERQTRLWRLASWALFVAQLGFAALVMNRLPAGFITNYGADLTQPAWLYILVRGLDSSRPRTQLNRLMGSKPEKAALVIFLASALTEMSQRYWPSGVFAGRFDPFDIVAFGAGIGTCYVLDKLGSKRIRGVAQTSQSGRRTVAYTGAGAKVWSPRGLYGRRPGDAWCQMAKVMEIGNGDLDF